MTYSEALAWLYSTQHHGIKLGLENIQRLLHSLGVKGTNQRVIHVAGTNGKGSVCALLDSICRAQGYRTGLYTSPHLIEFRERIRINGMMISEEAAAAGLSQIRSLVSHWEFCPTFFEITTALALAHFEGKWSTFGPPGLTGHEPTEITILETGLGGRLDATNAITPEVSVLTPIDFDHQAYLGNTLPAIAAEKAGIIKPGVPVVSATQLPEVSEVFLQTAQSRNAPLEFVTKPLAGYEIGLVGAHQFENAALAVRALELAKITVSETALKTGLRDVYWPGRFQRINRPGSQTEIILDGAHNRAAALHLADTWKSVFGREKATVILGILRDKDANEICEAIAPIASHFIATPVRSARSCSAEEVLEAIARTKGHAEIPAEVATDFPSALIAASSAPRVVVTGSLFLVGEALAFFEGNETRLSSQ